MKRSLYLRRGTTALGPFTFTKLQEDVQAGSLCESDLLSESKTGPWAEASQIDGLSFTTKGDSTVNDGTKTECSDDVHVPFSFPLEHPDVKDVNKTQELTTKPTSPKALTSKSPEVDQSAVEKPSRAPNDSFADYFGAVFVIAMIFIFGMCLLVLVIKPSPAPPLPYPQANTTEYRDKAKRFDKETAKARADFEKLRVYNMAMEGIEDERLSLRSMLKTLPSSKVVGFLNIIDRFERDYPVAPVKADPKRHKGLQIVKKAFTQFNDLLVQEISNNPTAWDVELQKLMNDITKLREFGDDFSKAMVNQQQGKLVGKLQLLAQRQTLVTPAELNMFQCLYYVPAQKGGRILFAAEIIKRTTGWVLDNSKTPPPWFYKESRLPLIPFVIRQSDLDLRKLTGDKQIVVKEMLSDANYPQKSPLLQFYQNHNKLIDKLEKQSSDIDLWAELLEHIPEARVFLGKYNDIGGGYLEVVDVKLNSLESVAKEVVEARRDIERFLRQ